MKNDKNKDKEIGKINLTNTLNGWSNYIIQINKKNTRTLIRQWSNYKT